MNLIGEWINWTGGPQPDSDLYVEVRRRSGGTERGKAGEFSWCGWASGDVRSAITIMAYRVLIDYEDEPAATRDSQERIAELLEANNRYLERARVAEARAIRAETGNLHLLIELSEVVFLRDLWKNHYTEIHKIMTWVRESLSDAHCGEGCQYNMPHILHNIDATLKNVGKEI